MIIKFKNELGTLEFNTKGEGDIKITDFEGWGLPTPTHYSVHFTGFDGQTTLNTYIKNRVITLSGDVSLAGLKQFFNVLSAGGELIINNKKITANTPALTIGKRYGRFIRFVLQFTCDNPYFTDYDITVPVYYREDVLSNPFTLPTVFTKGVSSVTYINPANKPASPEIVINCVNSGTYGGGITFENTTLNLKIKLLCSMQSGEAITINIANRTIISSKRGNMLKYLDDSTYIGDFFLCRGENILAVSTENPGEEIACHIIPCIKYPECDIYE